jgi:hypothetical protein
VAATFRLRALLVLTLAAFVPACEAYEPPPLPVLPTNPSAATAPSRLVLNAESRADERLDVLATVLSADGNGVPNVPVAFTIGAGSLDPPTATTDQTGTARTIALSTSMTTISATISGGIVSYVNVLRSPQF